MHLVWHRQIHILPLTPLLKYLAFDMTASDVQNRQTMTKRQPQDCKTMAELRVEIDALDAALVEQLAQRAGFIDRAIELKPAEGIPARAQDRVEEVLQNVRRKAEASHLDPDLIERLWRELIEWSIRRESVVLGHDD